MGCTGGVRGRGKWVRGIAAVEVFCISHTKLDESTVLGVAPHHHRSPDWLVIKASTATELI